MHSPVGIVGIGFTSGKAILSGVTGRLVIALRRS